MKTFENAKVGDKVWYVAKGWGEIKSVNSNSCSYPIAVTFDIHDTESFTSEGKSWIADTYPTLFWEEQKLDHNTKRKVEIDWLKVPMNTPVIVNNGYKRVFLCYLPNAVYKFICLLDNENQLNSKGTSSWPTCKIDPCVEIKEEWLKQ